MACWRFRISVMRVVGILGWRVSGAPLGHSKTGYIAALDTITPGSSLTMNGRIHAHGLLVKGDS